MPILRDPTALTLCCQEAGALRLIVRGRTSGALSLKPTAPDWVMGTSRAAASSAMADTDFDLARWRGAIVAHISEPRPMRDLVQPVG